MYRYPIVIFVLMALAACSPEATSDPEELMRLDREFSAFSKEHGAPAAWVAFFAQDSVQLSTGSQPALGLDRILEGFSNWPEDAVLTWEPEDGKISSAGDLGYTWGRYVLVTKDENGNDVTAQGKYTTIWQKKEGGNWKVVLDIGNQNPPPGSTP